MLANKNRIPGLDGLRAISIALVLVEHLPSCAGFPMTVDQAQLWRLSHIGRLGVRVFFVISGYLISTLLFRELEKSGKIDLVKFYFRRTLRIFPAYFVLVAVVAVLAAAGIIQLLPGDLFHAVTYTMNYHAPRAWWLGHAWSLAVEEQFYLLWPAVLLLFGRQRGLQGALLVVIALPFLRFGSHRYLGHDPLMGESFHTVADSIATGCLLAGFRDLLQRNPTWVAIRDSRAFFLVPFAVVAVHIAGQEHTGLRTLITYSAQNIGIAACLDWVLAKPRSAVGRFLELRPMVWVGAISYSLYLFQQLFLNCRAGGIAPPFPVNVALAFAAATVSYYLIERPALAMRERLEQRFWGRRESVQPTVVSSGTGR